MHKGAKLLAAAAVMTVGGCAQQGKLEIRASAAPLSATPRPVPYRIAEAAGQLALGNVALALESFRKALRDDPASVAALSGMAACYDRMGRYDLSRRNHEAALALAPADPSLLAAFAASLVQQGKSAEASAVRREIVTRQAAASPVAPAVAPQPIAVASTRLPPAQALASAAIAGPSVTVALPPARPYAAPAPDLRPARPLALQSVRPIEAVIAPLAAPALQVASAEPARTAPAPLAPIASEPPVAFATEPLVRPAERLVIADLIDPEPRPLPARPLAIAGPRVAIAPPRLERTALGEVALVTRQGPQWRPLLVASTATSAAIRFVPLRTAATQPMRILLLNAARHRALAARTRNLLATRGWERLAIGDAARVRQHSLILYPRHQRAAAQRLAAQFGYAIAARPSGRDLVVLLGRDSVRTGRRSRV